MSQSIVYVGIDVDDERYHGCALNRHTGEVLDFRFKRLNYVPEVQREGGQGASFSQ